ncbi:hypothetical protein [Streptosporangium sp. KLBMP 9127]|nr:hypothetical protein [Streptosporangium sp. KLBMP 9127]
MKGFAAGVVAGVLAAGGVSGVAEARAGDGLSIQIVSYPKVAQPGRPVAYRVEMRNAGPGDTVPPPLRVVLPPEVKLLNVDVVECRTGGGHEVTCPPRGPVRAGGTGAVTVVGLVDPHARGPLGAKAVLGTHTAETTTGVGEGADLALRLSRDGRPMRMARSGRQVFRIGAVIWNHGPHTVRDAQLFLRARQARLVEAVGARCGDSEGYVGCRVPAVQPGERARFELLFRSKRAAASASAVVYSAKFGDRRPGNDKARLRLG